MLDISLKMFPNLIYNIGRNGLYLYAYRLMYYHIKIAVEINSKYFPATCHHKSIW